MKKTSQPNIEAAIEVCDREMRVVDAELQAFQDFQSRLREIHSKQSPVGVTEPSSVRVISGRDETGRPGSDSLKSIRTAYCETVMAVPHFEDEYDETLRESLVNEFDERLAVHITKGSELTAILYGTLRERVKKRITSRKYYINGIEKERRALREIEDKLNDCEPRAVELHEAATSTDSAEKRFQLIERLNAIESECEHLTQKRQSFLHDPLGVGFPGKSGRDFIEYLYANQETEYPALNDILACLDSISNFRESIWSAKKTERDTT